MINILLISILSIWTPDSLTGALSIRTPNDGDVLDWELSGETWFDAWHVSGLTEREDGRGYYGYHISYETELVGSWRIECRTKIKTAKGISRQTGMIGRPVWRSSYIGAGIVGQGYKKPRGAFTISIPLPPNDFNPVSEVYKGEASWTTDFNLVHIWEIETWYDLPVWLTGSENAIPYILWRYYRENGVSDFQFKVGVRVRWL